MKTPVNLKPIRVPNFIITTAMSSPGARQEAPRFALDELEPEVLAGLCDEFRQNVFLKAGKGDPPV